MIKTTFPTLATASAEADRLAAASGREHRVWVAAARPTEFHVLDYGRLPPNHDCGCVYKGGLGMFKRRRVAAVPKEATS